MLACFSVSAVAYCSAPCWWVWCKSGSITRRCLSPLVFPDLPTVPLLLFLINKFLAFNLQGRAKSGGNSVSRDLIVGYILAGSFFAFL